MDNKKILNRVCGVDCHPGDNNCNLYCTGKSNEPATYSRELYPWETEGISELDFYKNKCNLLDNEMQLLAQKLDILLPAIKESWRMQKLSKGGWFIMCTHCGDHAYDEDPAHKPDCPINLVDTTDPYANWNQVVHKCYTAVLNASKDIKARNAVEKLYKYGVNK